MSAATTPASIPDLAPVLGGFILGAIFNVFLLGIVLSETFSYFRRYGSKDKFYPLVTTLCILVVVHSAITVRTAYHWSVENFANPSILSFSPWSFTVEPALTAIVASIVQFFLAWRVYAVSNRRLVIPILILVLSVGQLGWGIASTVMVGILKDFDKFSKFTYGAITWLILACLADGLITGALSYYLHAAKTEYGRTNTILDKIIARTIQTNSLSTLTAIINMLLFAFSPTTWHVLPQLLLAPLYTISCLVSLNSRGDSVVEFAAARNPLSFNEARSMDFGGGVAKNLEKGLGGGRPGNARGNSMRGDNMPMVHVVTMTSQSSECEDPVYPDKLDGEVKLLPHELTRKAGEQNWA